MNKQRSDKGRVRTLKEQTMQLNNEGSKRERKKTFLEKKSVKTFALKPAFMLKVNCEKQKNSFIKWFGLVQHNPLLQNAPK